MIFLWAMSFWAAMIVLVMTGYGIKEFQKYGIRPMSIGVLGIVTFGLGWCNVNSVSPFVRVNLGFLCMVCFVVIFGLAVGRGRWWLLWGLLGVFAAIARTYAPIADHEAQVMPVIAIEGVSLGGAAGLSVGEPLAGAVVAGGAQGLASVLVAWRHVKIHDLGRHDLAILILSILSAWIVGWMLSRIQSRFGHLA